VAKDFTQIHEAHLNSTQELNARMDALERLQSDGSMHSANSNSIECATASSNHSPLLENALRRISMLENADSLSRAAANLDSRISALENAPSPLSAAHSNLDARITAVSDAGSQQFGAMRTTIDTIEKRLHEMEQNSARFTLLGKELNADEATRSARHWKSHSNPRSHSQFSWLRRRLAGAIASYACAASQR
jgi:chromosome segregation ATPase